MNTNAGMIIAVTVDKKKSAQKIEDSQATAHMFNQLANLIKYIYIYIM